MADESERDRIPWTRRGGTLPEGWPCIRCLNYWATWQWRLMNERLQLNEATKRVRQRGWQHDWLLFLFVVADVCCVVLEVAINESARKLKKKRKKRKPQTRRGGGESKKKKMKNGEKQNSSLNPFVGSSFLCVFLSVFLSLSFCLSLSLSRNRNVAKIRGSCGRIPILGIPRCGVDDRVLRQRLHCAGIRLHCGPSVQSCDYHQNVSNMWTVKSASCIRQREQILFLYCDQLLRFGFITGAQSQTS